MAKRKMIMDGDPGHDDAIAIILAAAHPELELLGITTVSGNAEIEKTTNNALKICDLVSLQDVIVSKGAGKPLVRQQEAAPSIHGDTGLDGPDLPKPTRPWSTEHGADTIIRLISESPELITLIATGPLTNVALAFVKAPEIKPNIQEIVLMGGGTFGNWTPTAEFNIWADPEAAKIVFDSSIPLIVMGLDITHQALATPDVIEQIHHINNPVANITGELLHFFASTYKEQFDFDHPPVHDVLTVAYCVAPELFQTKDVNITIETKGEYTAGTMLVDLHHNTGREVNAQFGLQLDTEGFWKLMMEALRTYSK